MNPRLLIKPKNTIIQHVKKSNQINYLDLVSISSTNQKEKPISIPKPPNSPLVSVCISLNNSGLIYAE